MKPKKGTSLMDTQRRIKEIHREMDKLEKELKELKAMEKPFILVSECDKDYGIGEGAKHFVKVSHHKNRKCAIDKIGEYLSVWKYFQGKCRSTNRMVFTNVKFTLNGEVVISIPNLETDVGIKGTKHYIK
jgi:hypothetical protein